MITGRTAAIATVPSVASNDKVTAFSTFATVASHCELNGWWGALVARGALRTCETGTSSRQGVAADRLSSGLLD